MNTRQLTARLQELEQARQQLEALDRATQTLTPEERLIAQYLLLCPRKGNIDHLCQLLEIERSSIYRRRTQILAKLSPALRIDN